jgi:hypothetical protein
MRDRAIRGCLVGLILFAALFAIELAASKDSPLNQAHCDQGESNSAKDDKSANWTSLMRTPWSASINGACRAAIAVDRFTDEHHDSIIALGTIIIAMFTFTLWRSTRKLWEAAEQQRRDMLRSIMAAETSANAAKRSADLIPNIERPYVLISSITVEFTFNAAIGRSIPNITITFHNYGRTPANSDEMIIVTRILGQEPGDIGTFNPRDDPNLIAFEREIIIGADKTFACNSLCSDTIGDDNNHDFIKGTISLYCFGKIKYRDIFSDGHETIFCRRFNTLRNEFDIVGGIAKNHST